MEILSAQRQRVCLLFTCFFSIIFTAFPFNPAEAQILQSDNPVIVLDTGALQRNVPIGEMIQGREAGAYLIGLNDPNIDTPCRDTMI